MTYSSKYLRAVYSKTLTTIIFLQSSISALNNISNSNLWKTKSTLKLKDGKDYFPHLIYSGKSINTHKSILYTMKRIFKYDVLCLNDMFWNTSFLGVNYVTFWTLPIISMCQFNYLNNEYIWSPWESKGSSTSPSFH